jgi:hypothetical protein
MAEAQPGDIPEGFSDEHFRFFLMWHAPKPKKGLWKDYPIIACQNGNHRWEIIAVTDVEKMEYRRVKGTYLYVTPHAARLHLGEIMKKAKAESIRIARTTT